MPEAALSVGEELREIIHQQNWQQLRDRLRELNPSDVAATVEMGAAGRVTMGPESAVIETDGRLITTG
jgi:hypothetical protein